MTPPVTVENVSLSPAAPGYRAQISREFPGVKKRPLRSSSSSSAPPT
ncbi:respiratory nitrate reductase, alpha subunit domain protein [Mycobacterium kansasii 732]|nr:respiratory nitrate reductase, alpha subunit domain protein [Mycobacterium kansasii 732]